MPRERRPQTGSTNFDRRPRTGIENTATWKIQTIPAKVFTTTTSDSFVDPAKYGDVFTPRLTIDNSEKQQRALEKLDHIGTKRFGSVPLMFKAFKKQSGENISLRDFGEHIRKKGLDSDFPSEDQSVLFGIFDKKNEGIIMVSDLLNRIESGDPNCPIEGVQSRHAAAEPASSWTNRFTSEDSSEAAESYGISDDGTVIDGETLRDVFFRKGATKVIDKKLSKFINSGAVPVEFAPFYQQRSEELANRKKHAVLTDQKINSDAIKGRLEELIRIRETALQKRTARLVITGGGLQSLSLNTTLGTNSETSSPNGKDFSKAFPVSHQLKSSPRSPSRGSPSPRYGDFDETSPDVSQRSPLKPPSSPQPQSFQPVSDEELFAELQAEYTRNFSVDLRRTRIPPSMLASAAPSVGKRTFPEVDTEFARTGVGGGYGYADAPDASATTSRAYFSELIYEQPSARISREVVGDADRDSEARQRRRELRYERTKANLDVTTNRLEYDELHKQALQLTKNRNKNENMIRYESSIQLNDLKRFKDLPLQAMKKKPNFSVSDRMWGGQQREDSDGRDFATTYRTSFDSAVLTLPQSGGGDESSIS